MAPAIVVFALPTDDQMPIERRRSAEDFAPGPRDAAVARGVLRFGRIESVNLGIANCLEKAGWYVDENIMVGASRF